ncbi:hypothetical protein VST7929_02971 [Vibrio stylophorae]|uniref:Uncharacterized protein n=1 Tax=Vibrio stylophorae TaxID=659351 RepID=A0ABN8DXH1_9VIBR|nr:hypothetical protein VST7929_02971 [Vibrio stylophorae]
MFLVLRILRGFTGLVAGSIFCQLFLVAFGQDESLSSMGITSRVLLALAFIGFFIGLRIYINKKYTQGHGKPHPALGGFWGL